MSQPLSSAENFLLSPKTRQLTVESAMLSARAYRRANIRSSSIPDIESNIGKITALVNGYITGRLEPAFRSNYRSMKLGDVLERVERRLSALKITANKASVMAGKPDAIRNLRRSIKQNRREGVSTSTITALAGVLRTTVSWLSEGSGPEDLSNNSASVPVRGHAGAGGLIRDFCESAEPTEWVPSALPAGLHAAALEIVEDSLGPIFANWYALYDEIKLAPSDDLIGKLCVLETQDERVYLRRLNKGRGSRFNLESNRGTPMRNISVKWVAPVLSLMPR
jgi:hypothetical protein